MSIADELGLTANSDFAAVARQLLLGHRGVRSRASDLSPVADLVRTYDELAATALGPLLARGVAACLHDAAVPVRAQALLFVTQRPLAPGGDEIERIVAGDRSQFAGVRERPDADVDLEWSLLQALAARVAANIDDAVQLAKREIVKPGHGDAFAAALTMVDGDWVLLHLEAIGRACPEALDPIVVQLDRQQRDLVSVCQRIVRAGIMDKAALRRLLADALRGRAIDAILAHVP